MSMVIVVGLDFEKAGGFALDEAALVARAFPGSQIHLTETLLAIAPCPVLVAGPKPAPSADREPSVTPPCPDCIRVRETSRQREWWCDRHAHHAKRAHVFSYQRELPFEMHDYEVIPAGIDP